MTTDGVHRATAVPPPGASAKVDKERVLKHPDLRRRLCEPPVNCSRPEAWPGYIPSESDGQQLNHSVRRSVLWEIANEAYQRELAGGWTPPLDLNEPSNGDHQ